MKDKEYLESKRLESKRLEVLERIKPMCKAFGIADYDYEVEGGIEFLRVEGTRIGCSSNSIGAVIQELVGFIFICYWRGRSLGAFETQVKNQIKRYWINKEV